MAELSDRSISLIGLGAMGFPMAQNLAKKLPDSTKLFVYDLNQQAVEQLSTEFPHKVVKAKSARDAISPSSIVITMLPEGKHVRHVYTSSETGLQSLDLKGKIFIDCSTIDVETALAVQAYVTQVEPSASFYDAPVSGGVAGAAAGTLALYVGINESDKNYDTVFSILNLVGLKEKIIPCGKISLGLVAKTSHNYLAGVLNVAACETMNLGIRAGLDPKLLYRVLVAGAARNPLVERDNPVPGLVPTSASSNDYKPGFRASLMAKDMSLAVQMAKVYNSELVLGANALAKYQQALPEFGDRDFSIIYKLFAEKK